MCKFAQAAYSIARLHDTPLCSRAGLHAILLLDAESPCVDPHAWWDGELSDEKTRVGRLGVMYDR